MRSARRSVVAFLGSARRARRCARPIRTALDPPARLRLRQLPAHQAARLPAGHAGAHRRHRRGSARGVRPVAVAAHDPGARWSTSSPRRAPRSSPSTSIFAEPDRSSISRMVRDLVAFTDPETRRRSSRRRSRTTTRSWPTRSAQSPVVTGFGFDLKGGTASRRGASTACAFAGDAQSATPVPAAAGRHGEDASTCWRPRPRATAASIPTSSSVGRPARADAVPSRRPARRGLFPALSIEALRVAQGASTYLVKSSGASRRAVVRRAAPGSSPSRPATSRVADRRARQRDPLRHRPSCRALHLGARRAERQGTGREARRRTSSSSAPAPSACKDLRNTPVEDAVPGVEVHAQLAEQMLEQKFLARPDYADGAEFLYLAAIGLLFVLLLPRLSAGTDGDRRGDLHRHRPPRAVVRLFDRDQLLFDPIYPPVTLAAIYVGGSALAFMRTERERARDPRRLRPLPVARPGRAARAQSRACCSSAASSARSR